jgi:hypothetical protein
MFHAVSLQAKGPGYLRSGCKKKRYVTMRMFFASQVNCSSWETGFFFFWMTYIDYKCCDREDCCCGEAFSFEEVTVQQLQVCRLGPLLNYTHFDSIFAQVIKKSKICMQKRFEFGSTTW